MLLRVHRWQGLVGNIGRMPANDGERRGGALEKKLQNGLGKGGGNQDEEPLGVGSRKRIGTDLGTVRVSRYRQYIVKACVSQFVPCARVFIKFRNKSWDKN